MKILHHLLITGLLSLSLPSFANRPAEDDAQLNANTPAPQISDYSPQSNIAAPEQQGNSTPTDFNTDNHRQQEPNKSDTPQPAQHNRLVDFPTRGMSMEKVINELGPPTTRFPAVGNPPITRWKYPDRTVFFEYSRVIHVVAQ